MENSNNNIYKILVAVLIVALIILGQKYKTIKIEYEELGYLVEEYDYSLDKANNIIEEANSIIEGAQWYAWNSYEDMGVALENLYTVDTVLTPW